MAIDPYYGYYSEAPAPKQTRSQMITTGDYSVPNEQSPGSSAPGETTKTPIKETVVEPTYYGTITNSTAPPAPPQAANVPVTVPTQTTTSIAQQASIKLATQEVYKPMQTPYNPKITSPSPSQYYTIYSPPANQSPAIQTGVPQAIEQQFTSRFGQPTSLSNFAFSRGFIYGVASIPDFAIQVATAPSTIPQSIIDTGSSFATNPLFTTGALFGGIFGSKAIFKAANINPPKPETVRVKLVEDLKIDVTKGTATPKYKIFNVFKNPEVSQSNIADVTYARQAPGYTQTGRGTLRLTGESASKTQGTIEANNPFESTTKVNQISGFGDFYRLVKNKIIDQRQPILRLEMQPKETVFDVAQKPDIVNVKLPYPRELFEKAINQKSGQSPSDITKTPLSSTFGGQTQLGLQVRPIFSAFGEKVITASKPASIPPLVIPSLKQTTQTRQQQIYPFSKFKVKDEDQLSFVYPTKPISIQASQQTQTNIQPIKQITPQETKPKLLLNLSSITATTDRFAITPVSIQTPSQVPAFTLKTITAQPQKFNTIFIQSPITRLKTGSGFEIPKFKTPPTIPTTLGERSTKQFKSSAFFSGFDVFIRRKGKYKRVAKGLTKGAAIALGSRVAQNTLAATFKIRPGGMIQGNNQPQANAGFNLNSFYTKQEKGEQVYIQRRSNRLNTFGEKREIKQSKAIKNKLFGVF